MTTAAYNVVDICAVALLVVGIVQGVRNGLTRELAGMVIVAFALYIAWHHHKAWGEILVVHSRLTEQNAYALAFVIILLGAAVGLIVLRAILKKVVEIKFKDEIEHVGGAMAGFIKYAAIISSVILCISLWSHDYLHRVFAQQSMVGRAIYSQIPEAYEQLTMRYPDLPDMEDRRISRKDFREKYGDNRASAAAE